MSIDEEVNRTRLASVLVISIMAFAVFSGVGIALTSNTNTLSRVTFFNHELKPIRIPNVSATEVTPHSADPISDGKPN